MAGDLNLSLIISAQNRASAALQDVEKSLTQIEGRVGQGAGALEQAGDRSERAMGRSSLSVFRFTNAVENAAASIVARFSPALASTFQAFDNVADAGERAGGSFASMGAKLGIATGVLTVGATALLAYVGHLDALAAAQAKTNLAVARFDVGAVKGQLQETAEKLEFLRVRSEQTAGGFRNLITSVKDWITEGETAAQRTERLNEALRQILPHDVNARIAGATAAMAALNVAYGEFRQSLLATPEGRFAMGAGVVSRPAGLDLTDPGAVARAIGGESAQQIAAIQDQARGQRRALEFEQRRQLAAAQQAGLQPDNLALELAAIEAEFRPKITEVEQAAILGRVRAVLRRDEAIFAVLQQFTALQSPGAAQEAAGFDIGPVLAERQAAREAMFADAARREMIEGPGGIEGRPTPADQLQGLLGLRTEDLVTQARALGVAVNQAMIEGIFAPAAAADLALRSKAFFEGQQRAVLEAQAQGLGTDLGGQLSAGLALGMKDVVDEWGTAGENLRRATGEIARSMERQFGDSFFAVVTGKFNNLPSILQRTGESIARSLIEGFTRTMLNRALGSLFGAGGIALPFGAGGAGAGGLGGETVALTTASGQVIQIPAALLVGASGAGGGGAGGGFSLGNLPMPPLSLFGDLFGGLSEFLATPLFAASFGAGAIPAAGAEAALMAGVMTAGGTFSPAVTLGQALGGIGGAFGLGLTIFSALTGPPTVQSALTNAVGGAFSGALLGSAIWPGVGTAIGAIAGAVLGGSLSFLGKGGGKPKETQAQYKAKVDAAMSAILATGAQQWVTRLDGIVSLDELDRFLIRDPANLITFSGSTAGLVGAPGTSTFTEWIALYAGQGLGLKPGTGKTVFDADFDPARDVAILFENAAWAYPGAGEAVAAIRDAIRAKIQQLQSLSQVIFGFEEQIAGAAGKAGRPFGVTRQTLLPFTRLAEAQGQQLALLEDTILGFDDATKARILQELVRVDVDHDLRLIRVDPEPRLPITVGSMRTPPPSPAPAPGTSPAPGGPTGGTGLPGVGGFPGATPADPGLPGDFFTGGFWGGS